MDNLFILFYLLIFIVALIIIKDARLIVYNISIPSSFIISYILFAYIGYYLLYFQIDDRALLRNITNINIIINVGIYTSVCFLLVIFGFWFSANILKWEAEVRIYNLNPLSKKSFLMIIMLFIISIIALLSYIYHIKEIPIINFILYDFMGAPKLRSKATNEIIHGLYRYNFFLDNILPFLTFTLYSNYIINKKLNNLLYFIICLIITIFVSIITLIKAKVLIVIIGIYITYLLTKNKNIIFIIKYIIFILLISTILIYLQYKYYMYPSESNEYIFKIMLSRTFVTQISLSYFYLEMFPNFQPFLMGRSISNPMGIFPWEQYDLIIEVMYFIHPELKKMGLVGTAPTVFWAEIYANYGYIAPFILSPLLGIYIYGLCKIIRTINNNPIKIGILTYIIIIISKLSITGFFNIIINPTIYLMLIIAKIIDKSEKNREEYNKINC